MNSAAPALRALLARAIDYAGMFPPCSLSLEQTVANQAEYVRDATDSWMLNACVVPVEKFGALEPLLAPFDRDRPLRLSALGPRSTSQKEFVAALQNMSERITSFEKGNGGQAVIDQIEIAAPVDADVAEAEAILDDLRVPVFFEAPSSAAEVMISTIAAAKVGRIGYKLRTGGVTADAFPASSQIAKALVAAARYQVSIKFTAGLHHPVRQYRGEVSTKMYGFLNVLGAAVFAFDQKWDEKQTAAMLEDEDVKAFRFDGDMLIWREFEIDKQRITAQREYVKSFGSCSFNEPREDLRALHLL